MAELFDRNRVAITQHIGNVFREKELDKNSVCKNFLHTASDDKKYKTAYYNLDIIIAVGYIALLVAQSNPDDKEMMVRLIVNLIKN